MQFIKSLIIAESLIIFTGCAAKQIREGFYQGMFEGARIENRKELSPGDRAAKPEMDYQQYTNERKGRVDEHRE